MVVLGAVVFPDRKVTAAPVIGALWAAPVKTMAPMATLWAALKFTTTLLGAPKTRLGPGT